MTRIRYQTLTLLVSAVLAIGISAGCLPEEDSDWHWERTTTTEKKSHVSLSRLQKQLLADDVKDRYTNMFSHCGEKATPTGRDRCLNDKIRHACRNEFGIWADEQDSCEFQLRGYIQRLGGHDWMMR